MAGENEALLKSLFDDIVAMQNEADKMKQQEMLLRIGAVGLQLLGGFLDNVGRTADALERLADKYAPKPDETARDYIGIPS